MDRRILLAVGAVALGVVLFLVLRPEDTEGTSAEAPTTGATTDSTTTETETQTETQTETETETESETETATTETGPTRVVIVFRDGKVVGGVKRPSVQQGDRVVVLVRSDVSDEVHLHGYDLAVDVAPGEPARIRFTADLVGRFEIELEARHLPLAELEVEP